jgi:hypothetical protein
MAGMSRRTYRKSCAKSPCIETKAWKTSPATARHAPVAFLDCLKWIDAVH